ncbi:MAG: TetR/AcrR family transcriptional regulator [Actinomycetota bacterium]
MPSLPVKRNAASARRSYASSIRRGDAPRAILDAATTLFAEHGYLSTSIDAIAEKARVARPTIFAAVGTKADILKRVIDEAIAGDDAPIPVRERLWFQEALSARDAGTLLRLHARNARAMLDRVAPLMWAVQSAAEVDDDAKALWTTLESQRLKGQRPVARRLLEIGGVRDGYDERMISDVLWGVVALYRAFVEERGWSPKRFELWLGDTLCRLLLDTR